MYEITLAESCAYQVPILEFRGTPTGIGVTKVPPNRHPAADQHRHGRHGGRRRAGRRRAGDAAPECFIAALDALADAAPPLGGPAYERRP